MTVNQNVKGLVLPTAKPIPGGNPGAAAIQMQQQSAKTQAKLVNAVGGTRRKYGGKIVVPQYQMQYKVQNGTNQSPNNTIAQNAKYSTQAVANAKYDKYATQKGGKNKKSKKQKGKKGGYSRVRWGCYSGGKKTKSRHQKTNSSG
jgi:predicted fused transcriptional regulator/phosphomethylpyrimidine kinase